MGDPWEQKRYVGGRRPPSLEETKRKIAAHAQERMAHQAYAPIGLPFREPTESVEANGEQSVKCDPEVSPQCRVRAAEIIAAGLRVLARKHHPDLKGGSKEVMQEILQAVEFLRKKIQS